MATAATPIATATAPINASYCSLEDGGVAPPVWRLEEQAIVEAFRPSSCSCLSWETLCYVLAPVFATGTIVAIALPQTSGAREDSRLLHWFWWLVGLGIAAALGSCWRGIKASSHRSDPYVDAISKTLKSSSRRTALEASSRLGTITAPAEEETTAAATPLEQLWSLSEDAAAFALQQPDTQLAPYQRTLLCLQQPLNETLLDMSTLMQRVDHSEWHVRTSRGVLHPLASNRIQLIIRQVGCLVRDGQPLTRDYELKVVAQLLLGPDMTHLVAMTLTWTRAGTGETIFAAHCTSDQLLLQQSR
jgi:hypothetical protein